MKVKIKQPKTKNRITALLLALLLTAAILIPQIPVKAEGTTTESTDISENNGSGGTSAGAGDKLPVDSEDKTTITTNTDGTRTLRLSYFHSYTVDKKLITCKYTYYIKLDGKIVARSCVTDGMSDTGSIASERVIYLFSDKPFTYNGTCVITTDGSTTQTIDYEEQSAYKQNNFYYCSLDSVLYTDKEDENHNVGGFMNPYNFTTYYGEYGWKNKFNVITKDLDLSKDDYKETDTNPDSYVRDKSLGYLQGVRYYENKVTFEERDGVISWNASNPELNDCQIEIRANNFYVEWWNKKNSEIWIYKKYGDNVSYKDGKYTFKVLEPCRSWLSEKNVSSSNIKIQSYGTTEYYVRLLRLDKENNVVKCGGWVKIDINRGTSTQLPDSTSDTGDWNDDTGDWEDDDDSDDSYHDHVGGDGEILPVPDLNFDGILESIYSLFGLIGSFPSFLGQIFTFLPSWLISSISVSIALILVIAVYKMIRG